MDEEIAKFGFIIASIRQADGHIIHDTKWMNRNVPPELVVMQMRAVLRRFERDYFGTFDNNISPFGQE